MYISFSFVQDSQNENEKQLKIVQKSQKYKGMQKASNEAHQQCSNLKSLEATTNAPKPAKNVLKKKHQTIDQEELDNLDEDIVDAKKDLTQTKSKKYIIKSNFLLILTYTHFIVFYFIRLCFIEVLPKKDK